MPRPGIRGTQFLKLSLALSIAVVLYAVPSAMAEDSSGGAQFDPNAPATPITPTIAGSKAKLSKDGRTALIPEDAPQNVQDAIKAANAIAGKPYQWGGGHASFKSKGYDCSGAISYALHGAGVLSSPLDSTSFMSWGHGGRNAWITIYTNPGHAYAIIAGLRFDTSGVGGKGPRWRPEARSSSGFKVRHPKSF